MVSIKNKINPLNIFVVIENVVVRSMAKNSGNAVKLKNLNNDNF